MAARRQHMRTQVERQDPADVILSAGEGDAAFDAWTVEELEDDLGSMRSAFDGSDDLRPYEEHSASASCVSSSLRCRRFIFSLVRREGQDETRGVTSITFRRPA